jgi:hypothetical protein
MEILEAALQRHLTLNGNSRFAANSPAHISAIITQRSSDQSNFLHSRLRATLRGTAVTSKHIPAKQGIREPMERGAFLDIKIVIVIGKSSVKALVDGARNAGQAEFLFAGQDHPFTRLLEGSRPLRASTKTWPLVNRHICYILRTTQAAGTNLWHADDVYRLSASS